MFGTDITLSQILGPLVFYILSTITIISAILVITLRSLFKSALFLILCLFTIAGLFITLDAEFIAAVQVLIYIGAISVLILFAIMLTRRANDPLTQQKTRSFLLGAFVSALLLFFLILVVGKIALPEYPDVSSEEVLSEEVADIEEDVEGDNSDVETTTTESIGELLLTYYLLPFEIVSVLLLGAIIGAIVIARKEDKV